MLKFGRRISGRALAKSLVERADAARDQRRYAVAAALYDEAARLGDPRPGVRIQAGHMFKETGNFGDAERHYLEALKARPEDSDLALQLGHFYKVAGRLRDAETHYHRALELKPGWAEAERGIADLTATGIVAEAAPFAPGVMDDGKLVTEPGFVERALLTDRLVPELFPKSKAELLHRNAETVHMRRLGREERSAWGKMPTLHGVEALRGLCLSREPILEVQVLLNGLVIHREIPKVFDLLDERDDPHLRKYVFNMWIDFSGYVPGRYHLEVYCRDANGTVDAGGGRRSLRVYAVIGEPLPEPEIKGGGAWVPSTDPRDPRSVEEQLNSRPSAILEAKREVMPRPKNVVVYRTDQLGDVVASVPAMRRLRELLPDARLVCLATTANADILRTLGVFDEVIAVPFPDVREQRRRVMTPEDQEALKAKLAEYEFDVAIDLAPAGESRPLLLLAGARFLMGMGDEHWPWLDAGFTFNTHDRMARSDVMPASTKTLAMIEAFGCLLGSAARVVRRDDINREQLQRLGIGPDDRYAVLHTGARVQFSRWAHYNELAEQLLARTDLKVFVLTEEEGARDRVPPALMANDRFTFLDERLPFDDFDALVSYCQVFVGNDSGPKHLASLRGANVISMHLPRVNWGEWGQELGGLIVMRHLPCAACHVYHNPEECGKDYACIQHITLDEVMEAVMRYV